MNVDLTHRTLRRVGGLAVVAAIALTPIGALAATPKPKPKPAPPPYIKITMSDVVIS